MPKYHGRSIPAGLGPDHSLSYHTRTGHSYDSSPWAIFQCAENSGQAEKQRKGDQEFGTINTSTSKKPKGKKTKGQSSANTTGEEAIGSLGSRATEGVYHATASSPTASGWGGRAASSAGTARPLVLFLDSVNFPKVEASPR